MTMNKLLIPITLGAFIGILVISTIFYIDKKQSQNNNLYVDDTAILDAVEKINERTNQKNLLIESSAPNESIMPTPPLQ